MLRDPPADRDGSTPSKDEDFVHHLASGISASHRLKDLADVQELIGRSKLQLELVERLDASVRDEYQRLWQSAQTIPPEE